MRFFFKAILLSFRYKWTILASVMNALLIAVFWGASISTIYPFMEVIFEGETICSWVDNRIVKAEVESQQLQAEVNELQTELENADPEQRGAISGKIAIKEGRITAADKSLQLYTSIRPAIARWGPTTPFGTLVLIIGLLLVMTALKGICLILNTVLVARIAASTIADMRRIFFRQMMRMDQEKIDRVGSTRLMTMLSHQIGLVQSGLQALYGKSIREPLKILACLVVACLISWRLLLLSLLIAPIGGWLIRYLGKRMKQAAGREMQGFRAIFQSLLDTIVGIKVVKIYNRQRREQRRFKNAARSLKNLSVNIAFYDSLIRPTTELMAITTLGIAMLCGAYLVLNQETHLFGMRMSSRPLSASEMFMFFAMLAGIADPARKLTDIYNVLVRATMGSEVLFKTFDAPPSIAAPAKPKRAPTHCKNIRFENVTFGYTPGKPVLRNLDLEIPFGQTVALVGANGSGKSTIASLLARFYDPQEGNIYLDDVNIRQIRPRQLRKQIAIVSQDPILFRGTVWRNIRYASFSAGREEVLRASQLSHVMGFIDELPKRFQAPVGDRGTCVSGGQRQRIALARAILSDPGILILDEVTSQLDVRTEAAVLQSLREFIKNRTTILVTHRRSTAMIADRVVVLRAGRVVADMPAAEYDGGVEGGSRPHGKAA